MEELKRINARIARKQNGRLVLGVASIIFGIMLLGNYKYQAGITAEQNFIAKVYPDVYDILTERVLKEFES